MGFVLLLLMMALPAMSELSHRVAAQIGGIFLGMGYGVSAGALYQMAFHRNFALEINGNYNTGGMALGQGPIHSVGLDSSLQAMVYNFGETDFSKGFGLGLGIGMHYLADYNQNLFLDGDVLKKGTFLVFPLSIELFYQHVFANNLFIKSGFKGYLAQLSHQFSGREVKHAARILPMLYFDAGYSF